VAWRMSWAYIAGFFDGEGSVCCYDGKQKGRDSVRRVFRIQIYQNSEVVLEEIQAFLARNRISSKLRYHSRPDRVAKGHQGSWMLTVEGVRDTFRFLCCVEKYTIVKSKTVQEALAYIDGLREKALRGELHANAARAYANLERRD
jgi:intein/homing endonuclease